MRRRAYRNAKVRDRLEDGIGRWINQASGNALITRRFDWSKLLSLFWIPFIFWILSAIQNDEGLIPYFSLWVLLIGVAYVTMSSWFGTMNILLQEEATYQVPLKRTMIAKQATYYAIKSVVLVTAVVFLGAWYLAGDAVTAVKAALVFQGLVGVMFWASLIPKAWGMTEFLLSFGWFAVLLLGIMWDAAGRFFDRFLDSLPFLHFWELGAAGWLRTGGIFLIGGLAMMIFARAKGFFFRVDHHGYYDFLGFASLGEIDPDSVEFNESMEAVSSGRRNREPVGLLEKHLWKEFGPEERVTARAAGFCEENFLKALVKPCLLLLAIPFIVTYFPRDLWMTKWGSIPIIISVMTAGIGIATLVGLRKNSTSHFLEPRQVGFSSESVTPELLALPINPKAASRVIMRESILKWPILALPIAGILVFAHARASMEGFEMSLFFLKFYLGVLGILTIGSSGSYINTLLSGVARPIFPRFSCYGLGGLLVFIGFLLLIPFLLSVFVMMLSQISSLRALVFTIILLLSTLCIYGGWHCARQRIKNPRRDVMK